MKILIISEYITPVNTIAAIRWTKFGKYLSLNEGCTVDILTNQKCYEQGISDYTIYEYDKTLAQDLSSFNTIYEIPEPPKSKRVNHLFNHLKSRRSQNEDLRSNRSSRNESASPKNKERAFVSKIWGIYTKAKDYPRIESAISMDIPWETYDAIISSYGPKWVHLLAEQIKKSHPEIIWIADYRDPLVFSKLTDTKENRTFPSKHTGLAEYITNVAPDPKGLMLSKSQRCLWLPNGYDIADADSRERRVSDKFLISITGTLYDNGIARSDLRPLFSAVSSLIAAGDIDSKDIEIRYCGQSENIFIGQSGDFEDVPWKSDGLVPREEALALQDRSSILVLPIWNTRMSQGVISGRIYEYFSSAVPVLGLCAGDMPNSTIREMIDNANVGFCYEEPCRDEHYCQMLDFIKSKYYQWKSDGITSCDSNWTYIKTFEYSQLANKVFNLIECLKEERLTQTI